MRSISAIIPVLNGAALIGECLRSLETQCRPGDEIIVVDNGSSDGTPDLVAREFPAVRLARLTRNLGFAGGINRGLQDARNEVLVLVNHDVTLRSGCLEAMLRRLDESGPGIVGCKLLYPDGSTLQHAGGLIHYPRGESEHRGHHLPDDGQWDEAVQTDYVTGALLAFDRVVMEAIGYFDDGFFPIYYEEVDYCFRARAAGYSVFYDPAAAAIHHESQWQSPRGEAYLQTSQNGRLRFVIKNYEPSQLLADFVPAETAYLLALPPYALTDRRVMAQAYFKTLLSLPDVRGPATGDQAWTPATTREVETALANLHAAALQLAGKTASLDDVPWEIAERPFVSRFAPIARFREAWNNVSTKWFVRAILQQQIRFNRLATEQWIENGERLRMHSREMLMLARELAEVRRRLAQLEGRPVGGEPVDNARD